MIRTENEYKRSLEQIAHLKEQHERKLDKLREKGLSLDAMRGAASPMLLMVDDIQREVDQYERLQRGDMNALANLRDLGRMLIALRIARGVTQRELAVRLDVHESQVSRDERHEYHGVTIERAQRILGVLGATADVRLDLTPTSPIAPNPSQTP